MNTVVSFRWSSGVEPSFCTAERLLRPARAFRADHLTVRFLCLHGFALVKIWHIRTYVLTKTHPATKQLELIFPFYFPASLCLGWWRQLVMWRRGRARSPAASHTQRHGEGLVLGSHFLETTGEPRV